MSYVPLCDWGESNRNGKVYSNNDALQSMSGRKYELTHAPTWVVEDKVPVLERKVQRMNEMLEYMEDFLIYKGIINESEFQEFVEELNLIEDL